MAQPETMTVVIIEDDAGHATLIQMNLKKSGLNNPIVHLTDGQAGLDYIHEQMSKIPHDKLLVLLDLNMPVLDGFGVLEALKSKPETRKIPVIVLTSTDNPDEVKRCYDLGCNVFLTKPINYEDFIDAIRNLGLFISIIELPD